MTYGSSLPRGPSGIRLVLGVLCALTVALATVHATAQTRPRSLVVLGLRAPNGDDEAAANATEALRRAARNAGFEVPANAPALEQSMAAFGCDDSLPADCLAQIAGDLHAEHMLYGAVRRQGRGRAAQLRLEVALYDHASHSTTVRDQTLVVRTMTYSADSLTTPAERLIEALFPSPVDPPVPPAPPTPAPAPAPVAPLVTIHREPPPGRPVPIRRYIGIGAAGIGLALAGVGLLVFGLPWLRLRDEISDARPGDPFTNPPARAQVWQNYQPFAQNDAKATDYSAVCQAAAMNAPSYGPRGPNSPLPYEHIGQVKDICAQHSSLFLGEWGFVIAGAAVLVTGLILVFTDHTGDAPPDRNRRPHASTARSGPKFGFAPVVTPGYQGGIFHLQF